MASQHEPGHGADDTIAEQLDRAAIVAELTDPDHGQPAVDRIVNRIVEAAGVAILGVIVALVFGNAVARYGLRSPIIWSDEIVIALMPWLAMCGVFLSVRRRQLIRIDFFVNKLPYAVATAVTCMAYFLSAAMFVFFAFVSFNFLEMFGMDRTIYLRIPRGWFISAFSIGAAAVAIAFLINSVKVARHRD